MVATTAAMALLVLAFALGIPVAIWLLVESETGRTEAMDRESAERLARGESGDGHRDAARKRHWP